MLSKENPLIDDCNRVRCCRRKRNRNNPDFFRICWSRSNVGNDVVYARSCVCPFHFRWSWNVIGRTDKAVTFAPKGAVLLCTDNTDSKTESDTAERYAPMCVRVCVCEMRACLPFILRSAAVKRTFGPAFVTTRNSELCTPPDNGCYLRLRAQLHWWAYFGSSGIPRVESKNAYSDVGRWTVEWPKKKFLILFS